MIFRRFSTASHPHFQPFIARSSIRRQKSVRFSAVLSLFRHRFDFWQVTGVRLPDAFNLLYALQIKPGMSLHASRFSAVFQRKILRISNRLSNGFQFAKRNPFAFQPKFHFFAVGLLFGKSQRRFQPFFHFFVIGSTFGKSQVTISIQSHFHLPFRKKSFPQEEYVLLNGAVISLINPTIQ